MKVHDCTIRYAHSGKNMIANILPGVITRHATVSQAWKSTGPVTPNSLRGMRPEFQHVAQDTHASASFTSDGHSCSEEVKRHAPELPSILSQMSLLDTHPASVINDALHTPNCVCCGFFGAFVLSLTMERCCFTCLQKNPALWMLPGPEARDLFGLKQRDLDQVPSFKGILATENRASTNLTERIYNVRDAKYLAVARHGSRLLRPGMAQTLNVGQPQSYIDRWKQLHNVQMTLGPDQPATWDIHSLQVPNEYPGLGAVRLPVIMRQHGQVSVERGIWCLGCEALCRYWKDLSDDDRARAIAESDKWSSMARPVDARTLYKCEWTKEQFVIHSKRCLGIQILAEGDM